MRTFVAGFFLFFFLVGHAQRPSDPNAVMPGNVLKTAEPEGTGSAHFIAPGTEIVYTIFFQNTGTDTVYNLKIEDTISDLLDLKSLRVEASSHDFNQIFSNENLVQFTFPGIRLPNAASNEAMSKGYIRFRISQKPELAAGSVIYNKAKLFFDFIGPFLTNTTHHTIQSSPVSGVRETALLPLKVMVFPNPSNGNTTFRFDPSIVPKGVLNLYHPVGQLVMQASFSSAEVELDHAHLSPGMYYYLIEVDGYPVTRGSLVMN